MYSTSKWIGYGKGSQGPETLLDWKAAK